MFFSWYKYNNIYDILKPFYMLSRMIGVASYSIIGADTDGVIETKTRDLIPLVLTLCSQIYIVYLNLTLNLNVINSSSFVINSCCRIGLLIGLINLIIASISNHICKRIIWSFIGRTYDCDLKFEELKFKVNHKRERDELITFFAIVIVLFAVALVYMTYAILTTAQLPYRWQILFTLMYVNGSYALFIFNFIVLSRRLNVRFYHLNECFRYYFRTSDASSARNGINPSADIPCDALVIELAKIHDNLITAMENNNFCFSAQTMTSILNALLYTTFTCFQLYQSVVVYADNEDVSFMISNVIWCVFFFSIITLMIGVCSNTINEGKRTAHVIHQAINFTSDSDLIETLMQFSLQIEHRYPCITCGLFTYDWTLIYSIAGAFTSYLIILIQFHEAVPKDGPTVGTG